MIDVCDGKYVGPLTPDEVIEQYRYRILIHETYAGLVLDDPAWLSFGSYEYHLWAINGYEEGIRHILECYIVKYKCTLAEAFATIIKAITGIFRK